MSIASKDRFNTRTSLDRYQFQAIRRYLNAALKLPDPDEEWTADEIGVKGGTITAWERSGVIQQVEPAGNDTNCVWETTPGARAYAHDIADGRTTTPCGNATGFRTIEPGTYTCSSDDCDCRFDRETAKEVTA